MNRTLLLVLLILCGIVFVLSGAAAGFLGLRYLTHPARQGGTSLTLEVDAEVAIRREAEELASRVRELLVERGVADPRVEVRAEGSLAVLGVEPARQETVEEVSRELPIRRLETASGPQEIVLALPEEERRRIAEAAVRQAAEVMRHRLEALGVLGPRVIVEETRLARIRVELPGEVAGPRVENLLERTGWLEFRLVDYPPGGGGVASREEILAHYGDRVPANVEVRSGAARNRDGQTVGVLFYAVEKRPVITGRDLKTARTSFGEFNQPVVSFYLTGEGGRIFAEATGANIDRGLAILLDGRVQSAPRIKARIADSGIIEGGFTLREAQDLALVLRSGGMPAPAHILESRPISGGDWLRPLGVTGVACAVVCLVSGLAAALLGVKLLRTRRIGP